MSGVLMCLSIFKIWFCSFIFNRYEGQDKAVSAVKVVKFASLILICVFSHKNDKFLGWL